MTPTTINNERGGGRGDATGAASEQQISAMDWRLEHFLPAPFCNIYSLHVADDIFLSPADCGDEKTDDSASFPRTSPKGVFVCDINGWFRGWLIETNDNFEEAEKGGNSGLEKDIARLNLTEAVFAATPETPESVAQKQQLEIVSTDLRLWRRRLWLATCWVEYGGGVGPGGGGCPHHHGVSSSHSPSTTPLVPHRFFTALFRMTLPTPAEGERNENGKTDQIRIEKVEVFEQPGVPTLTRFLTRFSSKDGKKGGEKEEPSTLHWLTFNCGGGGGLSGGGGGSCWRDREEETMGAGVDGIGSAGGGGSGGGGIHALTIEFLGGNEDDEEQKQKKFRVRPAHRREMPPAIAGFLLSSADGGENNEGAEWFFPAGASVTRFLPFSYGKEEDDEGVVCFLLGFDNGTVMACTATDRKMLKLNAPISVLTVLDCCKNPPNNDDGSILVRLLVSSTLGPLSVWCLRLVTTTTKTTKIDNEKAEEKISLRWDPERCVALLADSDLHDAVTSCCVVGRGVFGPLSKSPLVFAGTYGEQLLVYSDFNVDFGEKNCPVPENLRGTKCRRLPAALIPVRQKVHVASPILSIVPLSSEGKTKENGEEMEKPSDRNSMLVAVLSYRGIHLYRVAPV